MSSAPKRDDEPKDDDARPSGVPVHNPHIVAEGAALTAAIAGGAIGSIAGPVGTAAGAAIGGAIGVAIGATMELVDRQANAHDRELDDTIGVTTGTIGEPARKKRPSRPPPEPTD